MKKILLATVFATVFTTVTATVAFADDAAVATTGDALTGVLLGVEGALQRTDFSQKLSTVSTTGVAATSKVKNPSYDLTGALSLGYFKSQDGLYYGAKLSVGKNLGERTKKPTSAAYNGIQLKVAQQYNVALVGQLGSYVGQNTVLYGLLGVKRVHYDFNIIATSVRTGTIDKNVGKTAWGPVLGFGMKQSLNESWGFNAELSYERYKQLKTGNVDAPTAVQQIGTSIKPQVWNATVGLSHKF
jgi:opacity protein-like surface antigen